MMRASFLGPVALVCLVACSSGSPSPSPSGASGSTAAAGASGKAGAGSGGSAGTSATAGAGGAVAGAGAGGSAAGAVGAAGAGGSGGTAGSAGSTGSSGAAGTVGSAGAAGASSGCAGMPLCDDFEADTAGMTPTGWTVYNHGGCSGSAAYSAVIDTTQFHSGGKSVKVTGGDSCGPMLLNTAAFANLTGGEVYGRFFVRMPSTTAFDHAVMASLGLDATTDSSSQYDQAKHLQLAPEQIGTTSALVWQTTDGNILPAKAPAAAPTTTFPTADTWTCIEFHVSANTNAIETWIDGKAISGLTFIPGTTTKMSGLNDQWTPAPLAPKSLGLGWIVFSAPSISLWYDDAAIGTKRIGCN